MLSLRCVCAGTVFISALFKKSSSLFLQCHSFIIYLSFVCPLSAFFFHVRVLKPCNFRALLVICFELRVLFTFTRFNDENAPAIGQTWYEQKQHISLPSEIDKSHLIPHCSDDWSFPPFTKIAKKHVNTKIDQLRKTQFYTVKKTFALIELIFFPSFSFILHLLSIWMIQ